MAFAFLRKKEDWALPAQVAKGVWTCFEKENKCCVLSVSKRKGWWRRVGTGGLSEVDGQVGR